MNDNHLIHPNLALAREHFENFAFDRLTSGETATLAIAAPLECGDAYQGDAGRPYLAGDTLGDIVANLNTALILCREPAPLPSTGRNRASRQLCDQLQRHDLAMCIRVCLALLGSGRDAGAQPIHDQITADAAKATAQARKGGPMPHSEFPNLAALIEGAADAIQAALPTRYVHHGRSYRLQVVVQLARVAIFDGMAADRSMLVTVVSLPNAQGGGDANATH